MRLNQDALYPGAMKSMVKFFSNSEPDQTRFEGNRWEKT